ncbi:hypothetical protein OC846_000136 [Tilletia horrida]|uniref:Uncharacterized protein n=1 Tax=Tilletia horrida TaxID=155126 RepID=A0AAN6JX79_9BASI|nr:hypothetical protein OC846_000136 [Tilletia horrida]KAK0570116.1 hypothetical protein OC861_000258 [Tilletia horrida]
MKFIGSAVVLALSASLVAANPRPTAAPVKRQTAPDFSGLNLSQLSSAYSQALNGLSTAAQQGGDSGFISSEKALIESAFSAAFSTLGGAAGGVSGAISSVLSEASTFLTSAASAGSSVASEISSTLSAESTSFTSELSSALSSASSALSSASTSASTSTPSGAAGHGYSFDMPVSLALTSVAGLVAAVFVL